MVGRWGMSRAIGPIAVLPADGQGPFLPGSSETSAKTQQLIDEEVRRIVETAHTEVTEELSNHRASLDSLVAELMAHETLDQTAAYAAAGLPVNRDALPGDAVSVNGSSPDLDPHDGPEPIG
jgi:cell division protease FtsH